MLLTSVITSLLKLLWILLSEDMLWFPCYGIFEGFFLFFFSDVFLEIYLTIN